MAQQYDPEQSWRQEQSAARQSRPQELTNGQTREQFIATMLARPSSCAESGPGRPQVRPKQQQGALSTQGKPQPAPSDVSIFHCEQLMYDFYLFMQMLM
jgi:hypothetical protein